MSPDCNETFHPPSMVQFPGGNFSGNLTGPPPDTGGGAIFVEYNPTCGMFDFIIEAVMMGILCLFGFTGNILSIMCLSRDKSKTATPLLLISLEVRKLDSSIFNFLERLATF